MKWMIQFESWLVGLLHDNNTGWKGYREGRCMVYRLWGGHIKERYKEALVGGEG